MDLPRWFIPLMDLGILALVAFAVMVWIFRERGKNAKKTEGKILAEVWLPTGYPVRKLVKPGPDAVVKLGDLGDYQLAGPKNLCKCGHDEKLHAMGIKGTDKEVKQPTRGKCSLCTCGSFDFKEAIAPVPRRSRWPLNPFLGLGMLQVDVRTEAWWLNNPEPITPIENRTLFTAVDAAFHTRQSDAEKASEEINEQQALHKELTSALANQPNKMIIYIGLAVIAILNIVGIVLMQRAAGG
jgi:hypothetical protein